MINPSKKSKSLGEGGIFANINHEILRIPCAGARFLKIGARLIRYRSL